MISLRRILCLNRIQGHQIVSVSFLPNLNMYVNFNIGSLRTPENRIFLSQSITSVPRLNRNINASHELSCAQGNFYRSGMRDLNPVSIDLFIYLGFYVTFNTVQVISRRVVGRAEKTSTCSLYGVLYCKLPTNGKQLPAFPLEAVRESNPGLRGRRRKCYHSATVAPQYPSTFIWEI